MADCPKCGFTQPDDQYCANCGVDMQAYKPAPDPLAKRMAENTSLQVVIVLLIVGTLFSGIYVSQKEAIDKTLRQALTSNSDPALNEDTKETETPVVTSATEVQALSAASEVQQAVTPTPTEALSAISRMEIAFAEVPQPLVQIWTNEGQILSEDSQMKSILISQEGSLRDLRRQDWEPYMLSGGATRNIVQAQNLSERYPNFESEVGMALDFQFSSLTSERMSFSVEAMLSLPAELDDSVSTSTITGTYEIPRGTILIIVGIIPQTSIRGEAADSLNGTPLSIMQSPEFLAGASEFALIIRPE